MNPRSRRGRFQVGSPRPGHDRFGRPKLAGIEAWQENTKLLVEELTKMEASANPAVVAAEAAVAQAKQALADAEAALTAAQQEATAPPAAPTVPDAAELNAGASSLRGLGQTAVATFLEQLAAG